MNRDSILPKRNAIFYLTYNGLYNFTNGIGTQTQLLLGGFEAVHEALTLQYGPIDLHVVCPAPDADTWGYEQAFFERQQQRLRALGGQVHLIPYKRRPGQDLWDIDSWQALCHNVAPLLHSQTAPYDRSLIICVDQPWLHTPAALNLSPADTASHQVDILLVLYSTAFIRHGDMPNAGELAWEEDGLAAARAGSRVALADICPSFTAHLRTHFKVAAAPFAPYTSSIHVDDPIFAVQDEAAVRATLQAHGIPLDAELIVAFGRAAPIKGFELLIPALAPLRHRVHFVLISVPYIGDTSPQRLYDQLLHQHGLRYTHIKAFSRELPRALCQWPRTRAAVVPSRQETFSNIPLEVALWARTGGPVVVGSAVGGFIDQIEPGMTGFLVDFQSAQGCTQTLQEVLDLPPEAHAVLRQRAYQQVIERFDFAQNFPQSLRWFWQRNPRQSVR